MRCGACMSPAISAIAWRWLWVSAKPKPASARRLQRAGADEDPAGPPAAARPHQRDGELGGQDLVIGEALARRHRGIEIGGAFWRMGGGDRLAPARPEAAFAPCRVEPFRQLRRALQRRRDGPCDEARGEAGGQLVDRLDRPHLLGLVRRDDIVGVGHLRHAVVVLDLAADHPLGADRQEALQVVALDVEIDQHQRARRIADEHPIGPPPNPGLVTFDLGLDRNDRAGRPIARVERADLRRGAAVDDPRRQVPQQIDDIGAGGALDEAPELRPDAGQCRHRGEERVEEGGTHGGIDNRESRLTMEPRMAISRMPFQPLTPTLSPQAGRGSDAAAIKAPRPPRA